MIGVKEKFSLFWLDGDVNNNDSNRKLQKELRSLVSRLETFEDRAKCQNHIEDLAQNGQLVLIVSGRLGEQVVPQIHGLPQVRVIYVYCMDKKSNEQWAGRFPKVKDVIIEQRVLLDRIRLDKISCAETEEFMSFNIYSLTRKPSPSTRDLRKQFTYSFALVELLLRLKTSPNDDKRLLALCKKESNDDNWTSTMFKAFKQEYPAYEALWWYTRESFLYDMLHDALANNNINQLLLCHFFVKGIHQELRQSQCQSSNPVYYGQLMTEGEYKYLERSVHAFMLVKTFLRTNSNRAQIEQVLRTRQFKKYFRRVLFIINVSPQVAAKKPFAAIDKVSGFSEPGAMLFMAGSIFRLIEVRTTGTADAIVRMELCNENAAELQPAFQYIRRISDDTDNTITLYELANVLARMGKYDTAEQIYEFLVNGTSLDDPSSVGLHCALAKTSTMKQEHDKCVTWYEKALKSQYRTDPANLIYIGQLHGFVADAYRSADNQEQALKNYKAAVEKYKQGNAQNHPDLADIYTSIGSIYRRQRKDNKAFDYYQKAIDIDRTSATLRPNAAKTHSDMGMIYYTRKEYDRALDEYKISIAIRRQTRAPSDLSLANALNNIGHVYSAMHDLEKALESYQQAAAIFTELRPPSHHDVITVHSHIEEITKNLRG